MPDVVSTLMSKIAVDVMEDDGFSYGLWSQSEIIGYIDNIQREFIYLSQALKQLGCVTASTSTRIYDDPPDSMQLDRIAFNAEALYRTEKLVLDRGNPKWRTESGRPQSYHQDQLEVRTFEVSKKPIAGMTGSGYTQSGTNGGLLRGMSGVRTYTTSGNGTLRHMWGSVAYTMIGVNGRPYGILRRMRTGVTNFETIHTLLPSQVTDTDDVLTVPRFCTMYLKYGVLSEMFAKEGEGQDIPRSRYCRVRYIKGVNLLRRLMGMAPLEEEIKRRG